MSQMEPAKLKEMSHIKGSERIQVNNILSAVCIGVLAVLLDSPAANLSSWSVAQLAMAIPCLVTSSLAYSKMCYHQLGEYGVWDRVGWGTHSAGYVMLLNALTVMLYRSRFRAVAWVFLGATVSLFLLYSVVDVLAKRARLGERVRKLCLHIALLACGSVVPILVGWA